MGEITCDFEGCKDTKYYGTLEYGASPKSTKAAVEKFTSLIQEAGPMLSISNECMGDFKTDLVETMLPRCSEKCEPLKSCKSACEDIQTKCLGNGLKGQLEMAMGLGSMVDSILGTSAPVIKAWVKKLTTCSGSSITTSSNECLSPTYKAPQCDMTVTATPTTKAPEDDDATTTKTPEEDNGKCQEITCDFEGCKDTKYYGTLEYGASPKSTKAAVEKFTSLIQMAGPLLSLSISNECIGDFKTDLVETMLPRCSEKCEPLKSCKSACEDIQTKCLGNGLKGQLEMAMGLGSMVDSYLGTSAPVIKAWVKKLTTCSGSSISTSSN